MGCPTAPMMLQRRRPCVPAKATHARCAGRDVVGEAGVADSALQLAQSERKKGDHRGCIHLAQDAQRAAQNRAVRVVQVSFFSLAARAIPSKARRGGAERRLGLRVAAVRRLLLATSAIVHRDARARRRRGKGIGACAHRCLLVLSRVRWRRQRWRRRLRRGGPERQRGPGP